MGCARTWLRPRPARPCAGSPTISTRRRKKIADLYKRRWRIELFFRLMKQTLRITKFIGRSENAVRIQIAVALIAYLLLRALQQVAKDASGFLELVRLVRANLMHRKDPTRLRNPPPPEPLDSSQLQLSFPST